MADIYAFGPDWALPAAVQDNIVSLIGSKTWVQPNVTAATTMSGSHRYNTATAFPTSV